MPNIYGLPEEELAKIRARDKFCVYCHIQMKEYPHKKGTSKDKATIEHLNTKQPFSNPGTVVICCGSCNSSRRDMELLDWFKKPYCMERNINEETIAEPANAYVRYERFVNQCTWTFAKTMPHNPHYYIVREGLSESDKKLFDDFGAYIETNGYTVVFGSKNYTCINIENYKYWVIDNILNRARMNP